MINSQPEVCPKGRYSIRETAQKLNISVSTVYRYIKEGTLKYAIRPNGKIIVIGSEITRFWGGEYI